MADLKPNVYQKIAEIIDSLGVVKKDSKAPAVMGGYEFTSHGALITHLRRELTSHGIVIRASGAELLKAEMYETIRTNNDKSTSVKMNFHSIVKFDFTVVNADDPSDFFIDSWIGEGMDSSDKGVQKAGTSAEKYFLMKLFKVGDKEDPDAIDPVGNSTISQSASISPNNGTPEPARPAGSPGAFSHRAVAETVAKTQNELEKLVAEAAPASIETSESTAITPTEYTPEQKVAQLQALVWLAGQLPSSTGWFPGKIAPMVSLWDARNKQGTLTPETGADATSGVNWVYSQLAQAHIENCGPTCEHLLAGKLAILSGGKITDPARA